MFGNSRQFFIMRQNDRADLGDMAHDIIALPEVTNAISDYGHPAAPTIIQKVRGDRVLTVHLFSHRAPAGNL